MAKLKRFKKPEKPPFYATIPATLIIIFLNIGVFWYFYNRPIVEMFIGRFILSPHNLFVKGNITSVITSGFIHRDVQHLAFNMMGVFIFGSIVEKRFGTAKTVLVYFGALFLSMFFAITVYTFFLDKNVAIIGASGAVMGLVSCAMLADPFAITYELIVPTPVMLKAWFFFYADLRGFLGGEKDGVSHLAHILGFLSITVIFYLLDKEDRRILFKGLIVNIISFVALLALIRYITA